MPASFSSFERLPVFNVPNNQRVLVLIAEADQKLLAGGEAQRFDADAVEIMPGRLFLCIEAPDDDIRSTADEIHLPRRDQSTPLSRNISGYEFDCRNNNIYVLETAIAEIVLVWPLRNCCWLFSVFRIDTFEPSGNIRCFSSGCNCRPLGIFPSKPKIVVGSSIVKFSELIFVDK